jgi:hypothetical protein
MAGNCMIRGVLSLFFTCVAAMPAAAQGLSAKELLPDVQDCSLTLTGERPPIEQDAEAMVLKVGKAEVGAGVMAHLFYFAPGKDGRRDDFGLLLDAPVDVVRKKLPALAKPAKVNGYVREISPVGDPDGSGNGEGKTLLVCRAGPPG